MDYAEAYRKLSVETATVAFIKKDGSLRVMLCTRNLSTSSVLYQDLGKMLGGHDNKCNIKNGNMAVIDLEIGESRSFGVGRVLYEEWHGEITTPEQLRDLIMNHRQRIAEGYFNNIKASDMLQNL